MNTKFAYEKPELVVIGELAKLTLGTGEGEHLDADYPQGTPRSELGWS